MSAATHRLLRSRSSDLELVYRVRGVDRPVLRGVSFAIGRGQSYGLVGESGCGKSTAALGHRPLPPAQRSRHGRLDLGRRAGRARARPPRAPRLPRADGLDGLPEPRLRAEPVAAGGRAGRRGVHGPRSAGQGGDRASARDALVTVQIADPSSVHEPLPAPALRRHAAARRDRHGAREEPRAADPRRADHRARRDRRGRGARSRLAAPGRARTPPCSSSATTSA